MNDKTQMVEAEESKGDLAPLSMFASPAAFEFAQRIARMFSQSELVPAAYRGDTAIGSCLIALDLAARLKASPLLVMQNLYAIEGRPSWSAKFLIATVNMNPRFSTLSFELATDANPRDVSYMGWEWDPQRHKNMPTEKMDRGVVNRTCRAVATDMATGERMEGPEVSLVMAMQEGWYHRRGSKWQTLPEVMLRYRAASFWVAVYASELAMGIPTTEEVGDIIDGEARVGRDDDEDAAARVNAEMASARAERSVEASEPAKADNEVPPRVAAAEEPMEPMEPAPREAEEDEDEEECDLPTHDADGVPYNPDFHSKNRSFNLGGKWRMRRNVDRATYLAWRDEVLRQVVDDDDEGEPAPEDDNVAEWLQSMIDGGETRDDLIEVHEAIGSAVQSNNIDNEQARDLTAKLAIRAQELGVSRQGNGSSS